MANGKIRVKSATEYTIEVNDDGDTIVFDISDTGLASRMVKTYEKLNALIEEYQERAKEIDARKDEPFQTVEIGGEKKTIITKNQIDGAEMMDELYAKARKTLDGFLGFGACQKIFGDKNYYAMFADLTDQLKPHFEKMGLNAQSVKTSVIKKYAPNREQRRALK